MLSEAQTIARLRSMIFLIEEALRIADEGDDPLHGAKLSDCLDCLEISLSTVHAVSPNRLTGQFALA